MPYYHRSLEPRLQKALQQFPVLLITGPRQAGKSTLLKNCFSSFPYFTLDDLALRQLANQDPELFLSTHPAPLVIDEIQYAPSLLSSIKRRVDEKRDLTGQYILTGSQSFQLMQGVSETLAGRVAIFHLYPFDWNEVSAIPGYEKNCFDELAVAEQIVKGFYPAFFATPQLDWNLWFSSYITTYLERDIRNIKAITDLARFHTFLSLLATRAGSLLNYSELAKECGISQPTAKDWLTLLQASYVIYLLPPYHKNVTKRLIKSPKLYFVDTGLLCYLLGIDSPQRFLKATEKGHLFENMVIMEQVKKGTEERRELYFYRTHAGEEIDLLISSKQELEAYEIKFSKSPTPAMGATLNKFMEEHPVKRGAVLCLRPTPLPFTSRLSAEFWRF